jgi:hypothetical protein
MNFWWLKFRFSARKVCLKILCCNHYFSPLNIFMRREGSGSGTLEKLVIGNPEEAREEWCFRNNSLHVALGPIGLRWRQQICHWSAIVILFAKSQLTWSRGLRGARGPSGRGLKVHKRENFLGSDIEICTFS